MSLADLWNRLFGDQQQKANSQRSLDAATGRALTGSGWTTPKWKGVYEGGTDLWLHADRQPYDAQAALAMPRHWESVIGSQWNNSGEAFHIQYQADMMRKANAMLHVGNTA
jgi:hypothetical protein